jgi:23S rRNA pseudouridine2605 synthase
MHPRYQIEREYAVRVDGRLSGEEVTHLTEGVLLEDGPARFDSLSDEGGEGRNRWYRVVLREGRNREVRRLFEALGRRVTRLMRIRFGPIALPPGMRRGQYRELDAADVGRIQAELRPGGPRAGERWPDARPLRHRRAAGD